MCALVGVRSCVGALIGGAQGGGRGRLAKSGMSAGGAGLLLVPGVSGVTEEGAALKCGPHVARPVAGALENHIRDLGLDSGAHKTCP